MNRRLLYEELRHHCVVSPIYGQSSRLAEPSPARPSKLFSNCSELQLTTTRVAPRTKHLGTEETPATNAPLCLGPSGSVILSGIFLFH